MKIFILVIVLSTYLTTSLLAADKKKEAEHGHEHEEEAEHGHEHEEEAEHGHEHEEEAEHGHGHEEGGGKAVGKDKAITVVDENKGFKLSPEATKTLKLSYRAIKGSRFEIKKSTLVASKNLRGVYRLRDGFYKLLEVKIISESKTGYTVKANGMKSGDKIVTKGLSLLRISDVYSTDKSNYGHSH